MVGSILKSAVSWDHPAILLCTNVAGRAAEQVFGLKKKCNISLCSLFEMVQLKHTILLRLVDKCLNLAFSSTASKY